MNSKAGRTMLRILKAVSKARKPWTSASLAKAAEVGQGKAREANKRLADAGIVERAGVRNRMLEWRLGKGGAEAVARLIRDLDDRKDPEVPLLRVHARNRRARNSAQAGDSP